MPDYNDLYGLDGGLDLSKLSFMNEDKPDVKADSPNQFIAGVKTGIDGLQSTGYGLVALIGDAVDNEWLRNKGIDGYVRNEKEAQDNGLNVQDYADVHSTNDAVDYVLGELGQAVPSIASMLAMGGIGGVIAKKGIELGIKKGLAREIASGRISKDVARRVLRQKMASSATKKAVQKWQGAGAFAGSSGMEAGEIYGDVAKEGGQGAEAIAKSLGFGALAGGLDALPVLSVAKKLGFGGELTSEAAKRIAGHSLGRRITSGAGKTALYEGVTEALQTGIEEFAKADILGKELPEDILHQMANAGLIGSFSGGVMGGAGGVIKPQAQIATDSTKQTQSVSPQDEPQSSLAGRLDQHINKPSIARDMAKDEADHAVLDVVDSVITKGSGLLGLPAPQNAPQSISPEGVVQAPIDEQQAFAEGQAHQNVIQPSLSEVQNAIHGTAPINAPAINLPEGDLGAVEIPNIGIIDGKAMPQSKADQVAIAKFEAQQGAEATVAPITKKNGNPFATEKSAKVALKAQGLSDTYVVQNTVGGFGLTPKESSAVDIKPTQETPLMAASDNISSEPSVNENKQPDITESVMSETTTEPAIRSEATDVRKSKSLINSDQLLTRIKQMGGINLVHRKDILGEGNAIKAGAGNLFRKSGKGLDTIAVELADEFNIPDADVGILMDMIRSSLDGKQALSNEGINNAEYQHQKDLEKQDKIEADMLAEYGESWQSVNNTNEQADALAQGLDDYVYIGNNAYPARSLTLKEALEIEDETNNPNNQNKQEGRNKANSRGRSESNALSGQIQQNADPSRRQDLQTKSGQQALLTGDKPKLSSDPIKLKESQNKPIDKTDESSLFGAAERADTKERQGELSVVKKSLTTELSQEAINTAEAEYKKYSIIQRRIRSKEITTKQGLKEAGVKRKIELDRKVVALGKEYQAARAGETSQETTVKPQESAPTEQNTELNAEKQVIKEDKSPKQAVLPKAKIDDFGAKIGGAAKDLYGLYSDKMNKAGNLDIATVPLSKSFPEPNYHKLIESGANSRLVSYARVLREDVPDKPRGRYARTSMIRKYVEDVNDARQKAEQAIRISMEGKSRALNNAMIPKDVEDKIALYEAVGHEKSLKGMELGRRFYTLYKGEKDVAFWSVEAKGVKSAFSNMPRELAHADTKEEAIKQFKAWHAIQQATPKEPKGIKFSVYKMRRTGKSGIGKDVGRHQYFFKDDFENAKEARAYLNEHHAEIEEHFKSWKEIPNHRRDENNPRVGDDHRDSKDVTPEMFLEAFGFRGVEFGNWVSKSGERQGHLNRAHDALMDLATLLNIPTKAISLDGELGLAFGARGRKGAAAHYERDSVVINLTRKQGAGSLAHEWFHALDNYVSRNRNQADGFITEKPYKQFKDNTRSELLEAFKQLQLAIRNTGLKERSSKLDTRKTKEYWGTGREMNARAFESYIIKSLGDQKYSNDYLANIVSEKAWAIEEEYPYIKASEIKVIKDAFDNLFKTFKTKETEKGTALYSKGKSPSTLSIAQAEQSLIKTFGSAIKRAIKSGKVVIHRTANDVPIGYNKLHEILFSKNKRTPDSEAGRARGEIYSSEETPYPHELKTSGAIELYIADTQSRIDKGEEIRYVPQEVYDYVDNGGNIPGIKYSKGGTVQGWTDKGVVHIVAENNTESTLASTLLHESLHSFLDGNSKAKTNAFKRLNAMRKMAGKRGKVADWIKVAEARAEAAETPQSQFNDEILAYSVTNYEQAPMSIKKWVDTFIGEIRAFLIKQFGADMKITPATLRAISRQHINNLASARYTNVGSTEHDYASKSEGGKPAFYDKMNERVMQEHPLFSKKASSYIAKVLKMLGKGESGLFQYPDSRAVDFGDIVSDVDTTGVMTVKEDASIVNADKAWTVSMKATIKGEDATKGVEVLQNGEYVWINATSLKSGISRGSLLYHAVATYAHNNGLIFRGDPAGLSSKAHYRRLENMLSSAIRFGTTNHLEPHVKQMKGLDEGGWKLGKLNWRKGDFDHNIESMIDLSYAYISKAAPSIKDFGFDFDTGEFYVRETSSNVAERGRKVSEKAWGKLTKSGRAKSQGIGSSTLKRAVFLKSLRDTTGVAKLQKFGGTSGLGESAKIFYSKSESPLKSPDTWNHEETVLESLEAKALYNFNRVRKVLQKTYGDNVVPESADAVKIEATFHGKAGEDFEVIERKHIKPALDILANAKLEVKDLEDYMYALHAPERNAAILKIDQKNRNGSGISDNEAQYILDGFSSEQTSQLKEAAKYIRSMLDNRLDTMVKQGLETKATVDMLRDKYPNYVPLSGNEEDQSLIAQMTGKKFDIRGKEIKKRALGRHSPAVDILPHAISQAQATVIRGRKAEVGRAIGELYLANKDKSLWEMHRVDTTKITDEEGNIFDVVEDIKKLPEGVSTTTKQIRGGEVVTVIDPTWKQKDNIFAFKADGKEYFLAIYDEALARQLKGLGVTDTGMVVRTLGAVNRYLSSIYTSLNPEFVLTNAMRDIQTAIARVAAKQDEFKAMSNGEIKNLKRSIISKWGSALKAITAHEFDVDSGNKEMRRWYDEYRAAGGKISFYSMQDIDSIKKRTDRDLEIAKGKATALPQKYFRGLLRGVSAVNAGVENAIRLSTYIALREAGVSKQNAAFEARNLTVDFNRKGEMGTLMNALFLFYNASIQGTRISYQVVHKGLQSKKGQAALFGVVATGFILAEMARQTMGEADDGEDEWDRIKDYEKRRNLILPFKGEGDEYYKFALPYGLNLIPNLGYWINDLYHYADSNGRKGKSPIKVAAEMLTATATSTNPIGDLYPTIMKPIVEIGMTNENFMGNRINKEQSPYSKFDLPDSETYTKKYDDSLEHGFASMLNTITGGDETTPGLIDVSPGTINYMVKYVTGGLGTFAIRTASLATKATNSDAEITARDIPFVRKGVGGRPDYADVVDYHKNISEPLKRVSQFDHAKPSERAALKAEYDIYIKLGRKAKNTDKIMRVRYKALRNARLRGDSDRVKRLKDLIRKAAIKYNKAYYESVR